MDFSLLRFLLFLFFAPKLRAQQTYFGTSASGCDSSDGTGPSPAYLYTCNGEKQSCKAFLIFHSQPPYDSVSAISKLTASDPSEVALINNVSDHKLLLPQNKEVIVPVNCSCSGEYYEAKASYPISTANDTIDTYFTIANDAYQRLTSCKALMRQNNFSALSLHPGLKLQVPLRCACPTSNQTADGTEFLLTYLVSLNDTVPIISKRFNISAKSVVYANRFPKDDPPLFAFTPIIIPLSVEPSSSQTIIHYPPGPTPSLSFPAPIHRNRRSKTVYVWIGIGILVLVLCLVISVVFLRQEKKGSPKSTEGQNKQVLQDLVSIAKVDEGLKVFGYEELKGATEGFCDKNLLDGSVYLGFLNRKAVAVKRMSKDVTEEVKLLKKINHFNLISLLGACEHCKDFYLVYEFMENGSLRGWLRRKSFPEVGSWNRRVLIALDIANALQYLHNFTSPAYVHKDINSTNVLLNKNLRAKIANFSLARSAGANGNSSKRYKQVSKGYMAPEYIEHGVVTPAIDIYAFGVILLELVTGKEAVLLQDGVEILLSEAVFSVMGGGNEEARADGLIDPNLKADHGMKFAVRMMNLGLACLAEEPESRPAIPQVLSSLLKIQFDANKSAPTSLVAVVCI